MGIADVSIRIGDVRTRNCNMPAATSQKWQIGRKQYNIPAALREKWIATKSRVLYISAGARPLPLRIKQQACQHQ
jgi:hypothetical protein